MKGLRVRRRIVFVVSCLALLMLAAQTAQAASIAIDSEPGRTNGGVYTTTQLDSSLTYSVVGNTGVPSGTPTCTMTVTGSSPQTAGPSACNAAPFSHVGTPFAPGMRADWAGGVAVSTSTEGVWTFTVQQSVDSVLLSAQQSWSVDNTAPVVNLASTPTLTNDSTPALPYAIVDANPGSSSCAVHPSSYASTPDYQPCGNPYTPATSLADGSYKFYVLHFDATGEFAHQAQASKTFTVDATGPTVTITLPTVNQLFNTSTPSLNISAVDPSPNTGVSSLECRYDSDSFVACNNSAILSPDLDDGAHTLSVRAIDGASNTTIVNRNFRIDTTNPTISLVEVPSPANDNTPTFSFTASDLNPGTSECRVYPFNTTAPAFGACSSASSFTPTALADGQWVMEVRHTDEAGLLGFANDAFTIDTVAPTITITSPQSGQVLETPVPELGLAVADPDPGTGVATFQCAFDNDALLLCGDDGFANRRLSDGAHSLTTRATDNAGNVSTSVVQFSVNSGLGGGSDAGPKPTKASFKRLSAKVRKGKLNLRVRTTLTLPSGVDAATACNGKLRLALRGKLKSKRAKTFSKQLTLKRVGSTCVATATYKLPRAYKGKRFSVTATHSGNTQLGAYKLTGRV